MFDEVKAGFRLAYGGAHHHYGVMPDLATFGKACCNGYPGSFVAGRRDILSHPDCQGAWLAATFHCDLLSLVALEAVMAEMRRRDGIAYLWRIGRRLMDGINQAFAEGGLSFRLLGAAPMPCPSMAEEDRERVMAVLRDCLRRGHYLHPSHSWFLSLSHSEQDIDSTIRAIRESVAEVA